MKINPANNLVALSALLVDLEGGAPSEIKLIPAGSFRSARDARPVDVPAWVMDDAIAAAVLSAQAALKGKFLFDYDHQTLRAEKNGQPAPAAGWGGRLEWRSGDGLYAVDMDWTPAALSAIASKEYRYISPVFLYDKKTGAVTSVKMAALTNYPALDDLTDLAAAAALIYSTPQDNPMNKQLLAALCAVLGLPGTATEVELSGELDKVKAQLTAADGTVTALSVALTAKDQGLVALSAQVAAGPDMSKYMPVEIVLSLQSELAALSAQAVENDLEKLIKDNERKLPTPELQAWAATQSVAVLSAYLEKAPEIVPRGMQTGGKNPVVDSQGHSGLTEGELAVCSAIGVDPAEFKKTKAA
ncbi:MAG: phage protease [Methylobacter sp.]